MLIIDGAVFISILIYLHHLKSSFLQTIISAIFYCLSTVGLMHFLYDSYDLVFIAALFWSTLLLGFLTKGRKFFGWIFFWVAAALKYINLPLLLPFIAVLGKRKTQSILRLAMVTFLIVWSAPLLFYQKSAFSPLKLHSQRGLQVESVPANISRFIGSLTKTEQFVTINEAVEIQGPVSSVVNTIYGYLFPLSLIIIISLLTKKIWVSKRVNNRPDFLVVITLLYLSSFMFFAKILSTPYLYWPVPFLTVLRIRNIKQKITIYGLYLFTILTSSLPIANLIIGFTNLHTLIGLTRGIVIGLLAIMSVGYIKKHYLIHESTIE
jgi:hypothetical protein